jgi:hypothetical protein
LARIRAYADQLDGASLKTRVQEWEETWRLLNMESDWFSSGIKPILFADPISIFFLDSNENEADSHDNTTTLLARLMEFERANRSPHNSLTMAKEISNDYPSASVLIVAARLLLFAPEMEYWEKLEHYKALFAFLFGIRVHSSVTSLGGLAACLIDDKSVKDLWVFLRTTLMRKHRLPNYDVLLATMLTAAVYHRVTGISFADDENELADDENESAEAMDNLILLRSTNEILSSLSILFKILGWSDGSAHGTRLRRNLDDAKLTWESAEINSVRDDILALCREVGRLPDEKFYGLRRNTCNEARPEPKEDHKKLWKLYSAIGNGPVEEWRSTASAFLFGRGQGNSNGMYKRYAKFFIREIKSGQLVSNLLSDLIYEIENDWGKIVEEKQAGGYGARTPLFSCAMTGSWESDLFIFFDPLIETALHELLTNVVHSGGESIPCPRPWLKHGMTNQERSSADMWWVAEEAEGGCLKIEFVNKFSYVDFKTIRLKPSPGLVWLEKCKGIVSISIVTSGLEEVKNTGFAEEDRFVLSSVVIPAKGMITAGVR